MLQCTRALPRLLSHSSSQSARSVSSYIPEWSNETLNNVENHKDFNNVVDYLVNEGEKTKKRLYPNSYSKYYKPQTWNSINQPETQRFLDELHDKMMAAKEKLQKQQDKEAMIGGDIHNEGAGNPPDNLLVLDHHTYIEQEELYKDYEAEMRDPNNLQLGRVVNNMPTIRNPINIMKNHGIKTGLRDMRDTGLNQGMAAVSRRYKDLKDRQWIQTPGSGLLRNNNMAKHLQDIYISHFEAIRDKEWPRLYSLLANQAAPYIKDQFKDKTVYWELVGEEKKPKILSNMYIPVSDEIKLNQVLARFTLRVKYAVLEEGKLLNKTVPLDEQVVEYHVVFERLSSHRHNNWIIVERVSKEDVDYYRDHISDMDGKEKKKKTEDLEKKENKRIKKENRRNRKIEKHRAAKDEIVPAS